MNRIRTAAVVAIASLSLAGCMSAGAKQEDGAVVGSAAGGLLGRSATGSADGGVAGALDGGIIGGAIGADLDAKDRRVALDAEYRALEYGRPGSAVQWRGHTGHAHGDVIAGTAYQVNDFSCRDFTHTIYVDGRPEVARGTACRQTDGTWKAVG
jgi:surface antigen